MKRAIGRRGGASQRLAQIGRDPGGTGQWRYLGDADRKLFSPDPLEVAPSLLGLLLVAGATAGRIVEVEAYRGTADPASHAFRGRTARNSTMFGPPGHLYVYFTYGMHFCCNVVCLDEGSAGAVLLRALEPVEGLPVMRARRAATRTGASARERVLPDIDLASGPGKLCQALGIDRRVDGADLLGQDSPVRLAAQESPSSTATPEVCSGPRVGIDHTSDTGLEPWRWWLCSNPHVSRARGGVRTGRRTSGIR